MVIDDLQTMPMGRIAFRQCGLPWAGNRLGASRAELDVVLREQEIQRPVQRYTQFLLGMWQLTY